MWTDGEWERNVTDINNIIVFVLIQNTFLSLVQLFRNSVVINIFFPSFLLADIAKMIQFEINNTFFCFPLLLSFLSNFTAPFFLYCIWISFIFSSHFTAAVILLLFIHFPSFFICYFSFFFYRVLIILLSFYFCGKWRGVGRNSYTKSKLTKQHPNSSYQIHGLKSHRSKFFTTVCAINGYTVEQASTERIGIALHSKKQLP